MLISVVTWLRSRAFSSVRSIMSTYEPLLTLGSPSLRSSEPARTYLFVSLFQCNRPPLSSLLRVVSRVASAIVRFTQRCDECDNRITCRCCPHLGKAKARALGEGSLESEENLGLRWPPSRRYAPARSLPPV